MQFTLLGLLVVPVCLWVASLGGCASFGTQWAQVRPPVTAPYAYIVVADADRVCRQVGFDAGGVIHGCAIPYQNTCTIYLPHDAPDWLVQHEEQHCLGRAHS